MTTLKYTADRTRGNNLSCNREYGQVRVFAGAHFRGYTGSEQNIIIAVKFLNLSLSDSKVSIGAGIVC